MAWLHSVSKVESTELYFIHIFDLGFFITSTDLPWLVYSAAGSTEREGSGWIHWIEQGVSVFELVFHVYFYSRTFRKIKIYL